MSPVPVADLADHSVYRPRPSASCDVVMKGGITSGVIYPKAICELARKYRLRQVGGSSAGAIAAAAAAAAEHGRESSAGGFARLAELPNWLGAPDADGGDSNLFHLFQPQPATAPYYRLFVGQMKVRGLMAKLGVITRAAVTAFPVRVIGLILAGLAIGLLPLLMDGGPWDILNLVAWTFIGLLASVVLVAVGAVRGFLREVKANGYGLCKGSRDPSTVGPPPLSDWLTTELNRLAGLPETGDPLTFGDLESQDIHLCMMTTGLNTGLPYRLPFSQRIWFYEPERLAEYFPENVINALNKSAPPQVDGDPPGYRRLPDSSDLPVVVAVRMSLSFPILLSAVPLASIDYTASDEEGNHKPEEHWFSDGGIVSNFPLYFFDKPLPATPTFGINLAKKEGLADEPADNTYLPTTNVSGILPRRASFNSVKDFGLQILDTMQNWSDNALTHVPGYRDRVVTVYHDGDEGGMNLNMTDELIEGLATRGQAAGVKLTQEFDFANHRWIRYRSTMELLEKLLADYANGFASPVKDHLPTYAEMIDGQLPTSYRTGWSRAMASSARVRTWAGADSLVSTASNWSQSDHSFSTGAPKPTPSLRIGPEV